MEQSNENKRRNFLKTGAFAGLIGSIVSFNPAKVFSANNGNTKNRIEVKVHPDAVQRNKKGTS